MAQYFVRRLLMMAPLLVVITFIAFVLVRLAPEGPFDQERVFASPESERALRAKYHLDQPVWRQYLHFLGGLAQGDLGPSMIYRNHSINDIIGQALPVTMLLGLLAFGLAQGIGIPLGFYTAVRKGQWGDWVGSFVSILAVCVPAFVVGPFLIMLLAIHLEWFPAGLWESAWHAVLPMAALGFYFSGRISRLMREGMATTLQADFIRAARAKGVSDMAILLRHAFRLAVLPVVSYSGPLLADLLTGSFVVETIFQIPGIGVFFVNGALNRDYTMVVGLVVLYAALLLVLNLVVDLAYTLLDRRIRYE